MKNCLPYGMTGAPTCEAGPMTTNVCIRSADFMTVIAAVMTEMVTSSCVVTATTFARHNGHALVATTHYAVDGDGNPYIVACPPPTAGGDDIHVNDFVLDAGVLTLTQNDGSSFDVTLPDTSGSGPVVEVQNAFGVAQYNALPL